MDFEVDDLVIALHTGNAQHAEHTRESELVFLAETALFQWHCSRASHAPRRDVIQRAFWAARLSGKRAHDFEPFKNAWIAAFRKLERETPANPEEFFDRKIGECNCAECAAKHAA